MRKLVNLFGFIAVVFVITSVLHALPAAPADEPGAGDIWWMNVPEINEMYEKVNVNK
ncbi:hypothetical protein [Alkalihalobacterium elongatum]|uniref:hypothetical protein n=1 Tax=Alkalihalobacterium elongatum TaxID=2675466 RepID=UPI001C1F6A5B|nr:hypothetical protein [Alkalihalobacterium elongatum]